MSETKEDYYYTIQTPSLAEYKDRGSKFLSYAYPITSVDDFKKNLLELKKEHPKANHYCFAYRLGIDNNNFRVSDAGEPSGSAGRPILGQIDSKNLTNILVIVVRYFGGTLLGVPGLINAYKTAAALSLQLTPIIRKPLTITLQFDFDYTQMNDIMGWIKKYNGEIIVQEMQLFCRIQCSIEKAKQTDAVQSLSDWHNIEWKLL